MLTPLLVFAGVFGVLGFNWWYRVHQIKALADKLGGQRLLGRGTLALETSDYVLDIVDSGWRVEVPRLRLGRRMTFSLDTGLKTSGGHSTGYAEIDKQFRILGDDGDLLATVFGEPQVRHALLRVQQLCRLVRLDVTAGETLVVLFRRRRRVSEREALDSVVGFANALNAVADIKTRASAGALLTGGVGGSSGSPFAMPTGR